MDFLKKAAGFVIGFVVVYFAIQMFKGSDKLAAFKEFRSEEGRFTVLMPGKPQTQNQILDTPVGKLEMNMFNAGSSKAAFIVSYTDYPEQVVNSTDPEKMLDGARDGAVRNVKGRLINEIKIDFHGMPARELRIEIPNKAFITARLILAKQRFYQLMFIAPDDKGHEQDISKFFDSFVIDGVK